MASSRGRPVTGSRVEGEVLAGPISGPDDLEVAVNFEVLIKLTMHMEAIPAPSRWVVNLVLLLQALVVAFWIYRRAISS